jgi:hypothetical protein
MIFKSEQKTDVDHFSPRPNPRSPRYVSVARVCINGFEGEAVLRNISIGGFRIESRTYASITVGEHYVMWIRPEAVSKLSSIELEVEVRWIQSTETNFSAGLLVVKQPVDQSFAKYIDFIKTQH